MSQEAAAPSASAVTQPAPVAPPSPATPPVAPAQSVPAEWTTSLSDDLKSYVQTKGFKAPQDVLESYRSYEKLQGVPQDRLLKIPDNLDTPEGRAIFEKLGLPKDAKEYNINIPKEHGDEQLATWMREVAHKNGFTKKQVEGLVTSWNERMGGQLKQTSEAQTMKSVQEEQGLKTAWGTAFEQNVNIAREAVSALELKKEQVDALQNSLGYDGVMKLLHKFGTATSEHAFVSGANPSRGALTPQTAMDRINTLINDKSFAARLNTGDAEATSEWNSLHKMAYPGTMTI